MINEAGVLSGERFVRSADVLGRAARAARGFGELGVEVGSAVAIMLRNDIPFIEASIGAGMVGGYPVPINWHWQGDEVRYLLENSGSRVLVVHADLLAQLDGAIPDDVEVLVVPTPPEIVESYHLDTASSSGLSVTSWDDFVAAYDPWTDSAPSAPASMIYTSGTTGRPKGVRRNRPAPEQAGGVRRLLETVFGMRAGMRTVIPAPMYHSAPNAYALAAAAMGAFVVLQPSFDPVELLALIERHQITHLQVVPTHFVRLLKLPEEVRRRHDVSSLEFVVHAAAPCPPDVKRAAIEWLGPVIYEYYGCTESGAVTFSTSEDWLAHPGTVGRAIDGATVEVHGPDGQRVPPGEVGEIYSRLSLVADFTYHGDAAKRAEIERDGLITCGDIGYLDDDGFLFLCDRAKDMVISGGVNIYPIEIEAVILAMPEVRDCAVFGIPDEDFGEALAAHVEPEPGTVLTPDAVRAHVRASLAGYKVPREVVLAEELPREDSGKIFKRHLRAPYWADAGRTI